MMKTILSVIAGYLVFAASSVVLFILSGQDPHSEATPLFKILTTLYGIVFSMVAGVVASRIDGKKTLTANSLLAVLIAGIAVASLLSSGGSHWTQLLAIVVFAPASVLGGLFSRKRFDV